MIYTDSRDIRMYDDLYGCMMIYMDNRDIRMYDGLYEQQRYQVEYDLHA